MTGHTSSAISRAVLVFALTLLVTIAHLVYYYPQLPPEVPTHFSPAGVPDSWSSRSSFLVMQIVLLGSIGLIFAGIGWLVGRIPDSLINLPNKEYWLAPEKKSGTLAVITEQMLWFGAATLLFFGFMNHLGVLVAVGQRESLGGSMWLLTLAYIVFSLVWSIRLILRFSKIPK